MLSKPGEARSKPISTQRRRKIVEENPDDIVRRLQRLPANKTCADCHSKLPQCVNLTHGTFICMACSGVHREFNHKIKVIGHSSFTAQEISVLDNTNEAVNADYLADYNHRDRVRPPQDNSDLIALRSWIQRKYVVKAWKAPKPPESSPYTAPVAGRKVITASPQTATVPQHAGDLFGFDSIASSSRRFGESVWDAFGESQPKAEMFSIGNRSENYKNSLMNDMAVSSSPSLRDDSTTIENECSSSSAPIFQADFGTLAQPTIVTLPRTSKNSLGQSSYHVGFVEYGGQPTMFAADFRQPNAANLTAIGDHSNVVESSTQQTLFLNEVDKISTLIGINAISRQTPVIDHHGEIDNFGNFDNLHQASVSIFNNQISLTNENLDPGSSSFQREPPGIFVVHKTQPSALIANPNIFPGTDKQVDDHTEFQSRNPVLSKDEKKNSAFDAFDCLLGPAPAFDDSTPEEVKTRLNLQTEIQSSDAESREATIDKIYFDEVNLSKGQTPDNHLLTTISGSTDNNSDQFSTSSVKVDRLQETVAMLQSLSVDQLLGVQQYVLCLNSTDKTASINHTPTVHPNTITMQNYQFSEINHKLQKTRKNSDNRVIATPYWRRTGMGDKAASESVENQTPGLVLPALVGMGGKVEVNTSHHPTQQSQNVCNCNIPGSSSSADTSVLPSALPQLEKEGNPFDMY